MEPVTVLQIGIIVLLLVIVAAAFACAWAYSAGLKRGRESTASELGGLATWLKMDSTQWMLTADERPYVEAERRAELAVRQDRSRVAFRGKQAETDWVGDGVTVGDQLATVCVETGPEGRRMSTMLLMADGDELQGVRLTVSHRKGAALVHPVRLVRRD